MYNMLANEMKWAIDDVRWFFFIWFVVCDKLLFWWQGEPYNFTHLIFLSRVYHLSEEEESLLANSASRRQRSSTEANSSTKKQKKHRPPEADQDEMARPSDGIYPFHPEDDILLKVHSSAKFLCSLTAPFTPYLPVLSSLYDISICCASTTLGARNTLAGCLWPRYSWTCYAHSRWRRRFERPWR